MRRSWGRKFLLLVLLLSFTLFILQSLLGEEEVGEAYYSPFRPSEVSFTNGRLTPLFIVAGAQKCGTTSLYRYLLHHPQIAPLAYNRSGGIPPMGNKEVRFFGKAKSNDTLDNYLQYFISEKEALAWPRQPVVTGEATPGYLFSPSAPDQIRRLLPNVRLIFMLRNPVDRANSHFYHMGVFNRTQRLKNSSSARQATFKEYIDLEMPLLQSCLRKSPNNMTAYFACFEPKAKRREPKLSLWGKQMLSRGLYALQVRRYLELFPRENLLFIKSEDFFLHPEAHMRNVERFLGLSPSAGWGRVVSSKYNFGVKNKISASRASDQLHQDLPPALRRELVDFFRPHNARLHELVGFSWDS